MSAAAQSEFGGAFAGKTVLVTGHTGFMGSWLSLWLSGLGARVVGLALPPEKPSLYESLGLARLVDSRAGDVRDAALVEKLVRDARPEVVFHLAAQTLARRSLEEPAETFATNVLGTARVLEAVRKTPAVRVCQVVTSGDGRGGSQDPRGASKAAAELVAASYRAAFFPAGAPRTPSLGAVRMGRALGGGEWTPDRLLPDCARALAAGRPIEVRRPRATRPWQFVLEPLSGCLSLAARQLAEPKAFAGDWDFAPAGPALDAAAVAELAVRAWGSGRWTSPPPDPAAPPEAARPALDGAQAAARLGWTPAYGAAEAVSQAVAWYRAASVPGFHAEAFSRAQIAMYVEAARRAGAAWTAPRPGTR